MRSERELMEIIGKRICLRRKQLGMTQTELGELAGCSFQNISRYEIGESIVSGPRLLNIARALKVSLSHFSDGLDDNDTVDVPQRQKAA